MRIKFEEKLNLYRASVGYGWLERWAYGETEEKAKRALNKELRDQPIMTY